ncbi:gametocyte-specific factor 1 isoform X1 [Etheostoma cragini]|uniref:gametocyte-specific factor 1 isoform X1 n=1 Tax=Etheostoma cragini TaxID=417921 RepID=UPI00155E9142|nr:gametocyte-specific factor 1 isoform X1 [Etheostoma cragini]
MCIQKADDLFISTLFLFVSYVNLNCIYPTRPISRVYQYKLAMATIRFGTSCSPCSTSPVLSAQFDEETNIKEEKGNCDPEKLLKCPFDKNHQIRACRFPYHLIKCRKNHPKLAMELKTCPFNARHLVPKHQLTYHTETCEDRISVETEAGGSTRGLSKWQVPVSTWVNQNMTEDWDEEADDDATPFVWGVNTVLTQKQEMRPTNNLGPSRMPNTLPWPQI